MSVRLVLVLCVSLAIVCGSAGDLGVVSLDEIIFDKLISRFNVSLVKFDTAFPYGEKHDQYAKFAREQNVLVKDLLIADVHTKDYGLKENWSLLKRFKINEKELPAIILFKSSGDTLRYPQDDPVTVNSLKNFVRKNTKLYIGLSGCIEEFDQIAAEYMEKFNRNEFPDLEKLTATLVHRLDISEDAEYKQKGLVYVQIMKRLREKGISFQDEERIRVTKLLSSNKLTPGKTKDLQDRLNVLLSFRDPTNASAEKSEL